MINQLPTLLMAWIGIAIAIPSLVFLWRRPVLLASLTVGVIFFVKTAEILLPLPGIGLADDGFTALTIARGAAECLHGRSARRHHYPGALFFAGSFMCGLLSSVNEGIPAGTIASAGYLAMKGVLLGWAVSWLPWTGRDVRLLARVGSWVMVAILGCVVLNLALPGVWLGLAVDPSSLTRFGLQAATGPFVHPYDLAFACSVFLAAVLPYRQHISRTWRSALLGLGAFVGVGASLRRKEIAGVLVVVGVLLSKYRSKAPVLVGLVLLPTLIVVGVPAITTMADQIYESYFVNGATQPRTALTVGSVVLANQYWPLGAGFGQWASRTAATSYSTEYYRLGIDKVWGLEPPPGMGDFLSDTSWPAIIGESGWLGAALFLLGLVTMARAGWRWDRDSDGVLTPELRFMGGVTLAWVILTLFESTGAPVFTSPPTYGFVFPAAGVATALANAWWHQREVDERSDEVVGTDVHISSGGR